MYLGVMRATLGKNAIDSYCCYPGFSSFLQEKLIKLLCAFEQFPDSGNGSFVNLGGIFCGFLFFIFRERICQFPQTIILEVATPLFHSFTRKRLNLK